MYIILYIKNRTIDNKFNRSQKNTVNRNLNSILHGVLQLQSKIPNVLDPVLKNVAMTCGDDLR